MSRKEQQHGGVKLTAKTARTLAMQEFGTARGLTKSTSFVGVYFMEFGNLRIEICADTACIAVRVVLANGTGSSVKYFDPDTLQENFKAIDKHREDEDRAIISNWVTPVPFWLDMNMTEITAWIEDINAAAKQK